MRRSRYGTKEVRQMKDKESATIQNAVINKAINYIFGHMEEDITVDDVARQCSYSR